MSIDQSLRISEFRNKINLLLQACQAEGIEMRPYFGVRTPLEQAKLWRQSRSRDQIVEKVAALKKVGATFLADCIESVGPQNGEPVTNAIPGLSWHQWGEAVDSVWIVGGQTEWSTQKRVGGVNGYSIYARQATAACLDPGGLWKSLKDWPHVQLRQESSPDRLYTLTEIDRIMRERFGG